MPVKVKQRGAPRWRGRVRIAGWEKAETKLFPDDSQKSYREAIKWEEETKAKITKALETEQRRLESLLVMEWLTEYMEYSQTRFTGKTVLEKKKCFRDFFSFAGDIYVEDVTPSIAGKYLQKQAQDRSGYAANKDRKNLIAAWNWGEETLDRFPAMRNPFKIVKKFPEKRNPRYVPPEKDFWAVYHAAGTQMKVMLKTFYHLGARRSEVFQLKWDDVDFERRAIRLWTGKRKGGVEFDVLPMGEQLYNTLTWWQKEHSLKGNPFVFPKTKDIAGRQDEIGKPYKHHQHIMKKLCEQAGVKPFGFHGIRHMVATKLYTEGVPVREIQQILRHRNITVTTKYLKSLGVEDVRNAIGILDSHGTMPEFSHTMVHADGTHNLQNG